jgi:hypothetical protein
LRRQSCTTVVEKQGQRQAELKNITLIVEISLQANILEKLIMAKVAAVGLHLLHKSIKIDRFQIRQLFPHQLCLANTADPSWVERKKRRLFASIINLQIAYDNAKREKLWRISDI